MCFAFSLGIVFAPQGRPELDTNDEGPFGVEKDVKQMFSGDKLNPERARRRQRHLRFRRVPINYVIPNAVTLLGLCAGVTAIRFAFEGRYADAVTAILLAAILDGLDGRIARALRSTSRFGAELDSLADFVSFGVAPAVVLYAWTLDGLGPIGWIVAMVYAVCMALRLARFNVALDDPDKPSWTSRFFTGVPAPAAALIALLPLYLHLMGAAAIPGVAVVTLIYTAIVAALMVSTVPTFSAKTLGSRIPRDVVLPGLVLFAVFAALLASYTWVTLTVGAIAYLIAIPFAWFRHKQYASGARIANDEPKTDEKSDQNADQSADGKADK